MNWRNLAVVFAAALVALVAYDVAIGPLIAQISLPADNTKKEED